MYVSNFYCLSFLSTYSVFQCVYLPISLSSFFRLTSMMIYCRARRGLTDGMWWQQQASLARREQTTLIVIQTNYFPSLSWWQCPSSCLLISFLFNLLNHLSPFPLKKTPGLSLLHCRHLGCPRSPQTHIQAGQWIISSSVRHIYFLRSSLPCRRRNFKYFFSRQASKRLAGNMCGISVSTRHAPGVEKSMKYLL